MHMCFTMYRREHHFVLGEYTFGNQQQHHGQVHNLLDELKPLTSLAAITRNPLNAWQNFRFDVQEQFHSRVIFFLVENNNLPNS